jgi:hypothetical protein
MLFDEEIVRVAQRVGLLLKKCQSAIRSLVLGSSSLNFQRTADSMITCGFRV